MSSSQTPVEALTHRPGAECDPKEQVQLLAAGRATVGDVDPEAVAVDTRFGQHLLLQAEDLLHPAPLLLDDHECATCLADHAGSLLQKSQAGLLAAGHADIPGHGGQGWQASVPVGGPQVDLAFRVRGHGENAFLCGIRSCCLTRPRQTGCE